MPKAFFVFGPESSGTRLMTMLLVSAGCYGDVSHAQRLDKAAPVGSPENIVWRRSFPHNHHWPDIPDMKNVVENWGYEPMAIVISRDSNATARSQSRVGHAKSPAASLQLQQQAYIRIFSGLYDTGLCFIVVHYDVLVTRPGPYLGWVFQMLSLPMPSDSLISGIRDESAKYYL